MLKKIIYIENYGVFRDFKWESIFSGKRIDDEKEADFKRINVILGNNYTGKTTLSRIFGSLNSNRDLLDDAKFSLKDGNGNSFTNDPDKKMSEVIEVYNKDFCKEYLSIEERNCIKPIKLILGNDNIKYKEELSQLIKKKSDLEGEYKICLCQLKNNKEEKEKLLSEYARYIKISLGDHNNFNRNNLRRFIEENENLIKKNRPR